MKQNRSELWLLNMVCISSLTGYLCFSVALRNWLGAWNYFNALYRGLISKSDSLWLQFWKRVFLVDSWDARQLVLVASLIALSICIAILVWRLLAGRINLVLSLALFVPACFIIPQILLAFLFWPDGRGRVTIGNHLAILFLTFLALIILLATTRGIKSKSRDEDSGDTIGIWGIAFLVPCIALFIISLICALGNHPGYDATSYHLPLAAGYGASNSILVKEAIPLNYPSNSELSLRYFVFSGNDCLASIPCFAAALLIVVILFKLWRLLGLARQPALIAACAATTFPVIPFLATDPNSDLLALVPMLSVPFFLIRLYRTKCEDAAYLWCLGLALGLAAGSRYYFLPACAFTMLILVFILRKRNQHSNINWRWLLLSLIKVICCIMIGCAFWFIRSWVLFKNPFFPISLFGLPGKPLDIINTIVGLLEAKPWMIAVYPWMEFDYSIYDSGVGAVFTAIVLPGLIWWLVYMVRNWKTEQGRFRFERMLIYFYVIFSLLFFLYRPSQYTRHHSFGILLSFFLVAEMWSKIHKPFFRVTLYLSFLVMCFSLGRSLTGGILYRLAIPLKTGAERFGLPSIVDNLPPSRIFNAASAHLTYGCMGRDYRHDILTVSQDAVPQDVLRLRADYLLINEKQKPIFEKNLRLELVDVVNRASPLESFYLYRVFLP
jgi:hypothetical protein